MVANDLFRFASFQFWQKYEKYFPKKFFNEIWVIIGDYEYINITEIKIVKVLFCFVLLFFSFS